MPTDKLEQCWHSKYKMYSNSWHKSGTKPQLHNAIDDNLADDD